jgi:ABC-2 type transport system permease protein/oleandomycin transport system permease protein
MNAIATTPTAPRKRASFSRVIGDSLAMAGRNLTVIWRTPQLLVFTAIQPILFVLMFTYVFGGAISVPGIPYVDYLMPGVFVQVVTFGAVNTGIGLAEDLHAGIIERFRSLPMARSAVLTGRTLSDLVRNVLVVLLMTAVGFTVGFRIHTNVLAFVAGLLILLLFSFALSWLFVIVGLRAPNAETAQAMAFPVLLPLVFASSAFVPVSTMPGWLQVFAEHQPVTATVNAVRALTIGGPTTTYVLTALAWSIGMIIAFAPAGVRTYRKVK